MEEINPSISPQPEKKPAHPHSPAEKERIQNRLRRVEGQIRGLQQMVEDDRYCVDILVQITAVQSALKKVGYSLLEHHAKTCVVHDVKNGKEDESIEELLKVIQQYAK
ncbi:DNA-binding FrmR family transcriptional regulator [Geomicrobium halophilum]|uniref:DNA-binding FrmR family transcriptional regulator n=1 Tax=Geomicrobium halophilum TaxID=549000 RepID=A0A841PKS8_9BACL|nr:metal-sensing transcriptional repressor [Geomicrobium halophilum]MBB6449467.1 DNA-binding FrmR family transcriptional regulator [Geomicrobium halophilum]